MFLTQGSNLHLLHRQVDFLSLSHVGSADLQEPASGHADKNMKMRILPKAPGDQEDWVPVEWDDERLTRWPTHSPPSCFANIEYGEGEDASLDRIFKHLEWTIKGRRHKANLFDLRLLLA